MSQREIEEAVAMATGENLAVIKNRGFSEADSIDANHDPKPWRPLAFDWDRMSPAEWPTW